MSVSAVTELELSYLDEDEWVPLPEPSFTVVDGGSSAGSASPLEVGVHDGLSCADADALAFEISDQYLAARDRVASLEAMVDELRTQLRSTHATMELLAEQNTMLTEEILLAAPMDTALTVHLSREDVRTLWREVRPGSRGPAPAAAIDAVVHAEDDVRVAMIGVARKALRDLAQDKTNRDEHKNSPEK